MYCEFNFSIMIFWMESNVKNMTLGISVNTSDCRINKYAMFENTFSRESSFMQKMLWIKSFFIKLFITDLLYYEFESYFMWNKHPGYEHRHMNIWMSGIAHMDLTDYQITSENTINLNREWYMYLVMWLYRIIQFRTNRQYALITSFKCATEVATNICLTIICQL